MNTVKLFYGSLNLILMDNRSYRPFQWLLAVAFLCEPFALSQPVGVGDDYLRIHAGASDPLFTTYAAAMERSRLYGDKAYKMDYYSFSEPLHYSGDQAGRFYTVWMVNKLVIDRIHRYHKPPVVTSSFPDMAVMEYEPYPGLEVQEVFFVYSSSMAMVQQHMINRSTVPIAVDLYPVLELGNDSLEIQYFDPEANGYVTHHFETKKRLISNLYAHAPYPEHTRDLFAMTEPLYSFGGYRGTIDGFYNTIKTDWYAGERIDSLNMLTGGLVDFVALHARFSLEPGEERTVRYFRGWQDQQEEVGILAGQLKAMKTASLQPYVEENVSLFASVPRIGFEDEALRLVYLGAFNLVRGCMLPPAEQTSHNFYVFSRHPLWGWGHGHQVLHESLSMLAYVYLDPPSAQGSQRVYMEQQGRDGLIAYRHGPRGAQTYPHKGMPTTSAPFFSWINLEIFRVSRDRQFLEEAYASGAKYTDWLYRNRDTDRDGTFEWGPYGIIENVRDWYNVVFQVSKERYLGVDKEDISDELECLDLSLMVMNELNCLAEMASELGKKREERKWRQKAEVLARKINERMWDEESGFYYHVDKVNHSFMFMDRDLRRQEIIGFLPLWAGVAPVERAQRLITTLTDTAKFWRRFSVPTLAADDEWYSADVDYCCKWNGPVWLLWDYMVFEGLMRYGYHDLAMELGRKMIDAVTVQLSKNHNYWESYSPDNTILDCPPNYIWDAIMARLLIRMYGN